MPESLPPIPSTANSGRTESAGISRSTHAARATALWVLLQTVVVALCITRVAIWMGSANDDANAIRILITAQIAGSSLLVGFLMPCAMASICVVLSSIPFVHLACVLSAAQGLAILRVEAAVVAWLATLAIWSGICRSDAQRAVLAAISSTFSIGGATLLYLCAEFGSSPTSYHCVPFGPIPAAIAQMQVIATTGLLGNAWMVLTAPLAIGLITAFAHPGAKARQVIHNLTS